MTARESQPTTLKPRPCWYRFRLRTLLLIVLVLSLASSWIAVGLRKEKRQRQAYEQIELGIYTCDIPSFPWYSGWLHKMFGNEESHDLTLLVFNGFTSINDNTLEAVAQFDHLKQLWLNGQIAITDAGLEQLTRLERLRDLSLGDARVTAEAVQRLRQALPNCEISWNPPTQDERQGRASPDQLR